RPAGVRGGRRGHGARPLGGRRPAHGDGLALHHGARPDGRPRGHAERLSVRSPRWWSRTNPSSPRMTTAIPATCRPLTISPRSRNDHTTASAGCAVWAIPIVPIWI